MDNLTAGDAINLAMPPRCARCERPMEENTPYRRCEFCRKKSRDYNKEYMAKRKLHKLTGVENVPVGQTSTVPAVGSTTKRKLNEKDGVTSSKMPTGMGIVNAVVGKEKNMEVVASGATAVNPAFWSGNAIQRTKGTTEYQTASALYDALKLVKTKGSYLFRGGYSIVHVEDFSHRKRAKLVTVELKKNSRLLFDHAAPTVAWGNNKQTVCLTFKCECHSEKQRTSTSQGVPTTAPTLLNSLQCGGVITIIVYVDSSHPLGTIVGQRIEVDVQHQ